VENWVSSIDEDNSRQVQIPDEFALHANYPNPFNPQTMINYDISVKTNVRIDVFDITGKYINTLVDEVKRPGSYSVAFDGRNLSSGIYFYRLKAGTFTDFKRMVLIK
jgi:hypothetical protein